MKSDTIDRLFWQISLHDDESAFQLLFSDFFAPLCFFANRYISASDVCEDLVQEVFYQTWKNRKKIRITSSARNYLVTNVKNACIDYMRRRDLEDIYREKQGVTMDAENVDDEGVYGITELEEMLNTALEKLPENVRRTFEMSRFEDKTYLQIADECGMSVKTVESHVSRVLKLLRTELKDYLPFILTYLYSSIK